jgi:mono/diheme cytochrome c family protein
MNFASGKMGGALVAAWALSAVAGSALAAEKQAVTYENTIKKIIAGKCAACHGAGAPTLAEFEKDKDGWKKKSKGPSLNTYANVAVLVNGSDAGAIMRRLDDGKSAKDGKPGNMHVFLGGDDAERAKNLSLFKAWVGNWSLKRRKDLTDAELRKITAPEK